MSIRISQPQSGIGGWTFFENALGKVRGEKRGDVEPSPHTSHLLCMGIPKPGIAFLSCTLHQTAKDLADADDTRRLIGRNVLLTIAALTRSKNHKKREDSDEKYFVHLREKSRKQLRLRRSRNGSRPAGLDTPSCPVREPCLDDR